MGHGPSHDKLPNRLSIYITFVQVFIVQVFEHHLILWVLN
jgi:hypothetical protein